MKKAIRVIVLLAAILACSATANAQFRWGVKAGVNVNSLHFNSGVIDDVTSSDNRTGFTGGLMTEFRMPFFGWCVDASLMYTHRVNNIQDTSTEGTNTGMRTYNNDYLEIPINIKKKFDFPVIGNFLVPYVYTGPSFAFLVSNKAVSNAIRNKSVDIAWNLGIGIELLSHLQVSASYGWGINKVAEFTGANNQTVDLGRNNCWTVTAAYLF